MKLVATQTDLDNLEKMRNEVPYHIYEAAARRFGIKPEPRPSDNSWGAPESQKAVPAVRHRQAAPEARGEFIPAHTQLNTWRNFANHPELNEMGHGPYNADLIGRFLTDENLPITRENLEFAIGELASHQMFRTRTAGKSGGALVKMYDIELLRADRAAAPWRALENATSKSEVFAAAAQIVRASYPDLDPKSDAFTKQVDRVIQKQVRSNFKPDRNKLRNDYRF